MASCGVWEERPQPTGAKSDAKAMEANADLIIKSLPVVRDLPERSAA